MSSSRTRILDRDGFVWCYELTSEHLRLRLFRVLTVGSIALRSVVYVRQRGATDLAELMRDMLLKPFRTWYWPHPAMSYNTSHSTPYVIRTASGTRVFVRLRGGFHYRLRDAFGNARVAHRRTESDAAEARGPMAAG